MSTNLGEQTGIVLSHRTPLQGTTVFSVYKKPKKKYSKICGYCHQPFTSLSASSRYHSDCQIAVTEQNWRKRTASEVSKRLSFGWEGIEAYKKQCEETEKRNKNDE